MNPFRLMHRGVDALQGVPVVRQLIEARFHREFLHDPYARLFEGVYSTFDEAQQAIPADVNASYDNRETIERYVRRQDLEEYDYQPLFWIGESFREGLRTVADVGGSVGIKYYAFAKFISIPDDATWCVIDVPAAVMLGRDIARNHDPPTHLVFTDAITDADGADVLLCLGSLQFLPQTLGEILQSLTKKPHRIVVNTTPIHETRSFFTLHSMGTGICPYRIVARNAFIDAVCAAGYRLRHQWRNLNKDMRLPFRAEYDVAHFSGFCFDRA